MNALKSLIASLLVCGLATTAAANEEPVPLEPVRVSFGAPGILLIDANEPNNLFEATSDTPEFNDFAEYLMYLEMTINAALVYDEQGLPFSYALEMHSSGDVLYVDPDTHTLEQTEDPVGLLIGGTRGYVIIAGEVYCVRPEICGYPEEGMSVGNMLASVEARRLGAWVEIPQHPWPGPEELWGFLDNPMSIYGDTEPVFFWDPTSENPYHKVVVRVYGVTTKDTRPLDVRESRIGFCEDGTLCVLVSRPDNYLRHEITFFDLENWDPNAAKLVREREDINTRILRSEFRFPTEENPYYPFLPHSSRTHHYGVENHHGTDDARFTYTNWHQRAHP